jgi:uncharacterized membrane protein YhaH (DUF805 family)
MAAKLLTLIWQIYFVVLGIATFTLIVWGLSDLGVPWWLAGAGALLLALFPGVGQIVAIYGLKNTFALSWLSAIAMVVGAVVLLMVLYLIAGWANDRGRAR